MRRKQQELLKKQEAEMEKQRKEQALYELAEMRRQQRDEFARRQFLQME